MMFRRQACCGDARFHKLTAMQVEWKGMCAESAAIWNHLLRTKKKADGKRKSKKTALTKSRSAAGDEK